MIKPSRSFQDPSNNHIVQAVKTLSSIRRLISSLVCRSLLRACQIRVPGSTVKEKLTWASHGKSPARPACPQATPTGSGEISKTCHANHKTNDTNGTWHIMEQSEQSQTIGKGLHVTPWRKAPHHHHCLHHLSSAENITKHWNNWNSLTEYHRSERLELQREAFFVNLIPFTRQRKSMLLNWLNCQCSLVLRKLFLSSWALVSLLLGSSNSNNLSELLGGSALRNGAGVEDCTPHLHLTLRGGIDSYAHILPARNCAVSESLQPLILVHQWYSRSLKIKHRGFRSVWVDKSCASCQVVGFSTRCHNASRYSRYFQLFPSRPESLPNHPNPRLEGFGSSCHKIWPIDLRLIFDTERYIPVFKHIQTCSSSFNNWIRESAEDLSKPLEESVRTKCCRKSIFIMPSEDCRASGARSLGHPQVKPCETVKPSYPCHILVISLWYPCDMPVIALSLAASGVRPKWPKCNVPRWAKNASNCK